jgi:hypothetical protein
MTTFDTRTSAQERSWDRLTLASGILAGVLFISSMVLFIGWIAPAMPPIGAPAAEHAVFYAEQSRNPLYTLIRFLIMAQLAPLALFFSGLHTQLRQAEGQGGTLAGAVFAAGMIVALITPLVEMIEGHLLLGLAAAGGDALVTRNFDGMTPMSFALSGFPQAVVLAGTGALILARHAGPRWLGWCSIGLALFSLIGTGTLIMPALFFLGTLSAILFKVWMVVLSIALLRRAVPVQQPASSHGAPSRAA